MDQEPGDDYIRRLASFIRTNEKNIAEGGFPRRRRTLRPAPEAASLFNPLGWFSSDPTGHSTPPPKPVILSVDTHRLFYVLMRMEALGFEVGTLDVQVDNPSRPMSYINIFSDSDKSDTLSLASFRSSLSAVSGLSLGGGWWGRPEPPSVDSELRYLFSSFTKVPALRVNSPGRKIIAELLNESPNQNALPLDAFKNLQSLECVDIDPRTLLGWDRLAEGLRSLKVKKSGLEDISVIFIGAVIDDQARRGGSTSRKRRRRIPHGPAKDTSFFITRLPDSVPEASDAEESGLNDDGESGPQLESGSSSPPPPAELSSNKWAFLKHLSLPDNSLTFFPSDAIPYLTSLVHLDLASNLLVSVPPGLGALYNLVSLNLSDNMIDSVLGIYLNLGQVLSLNMAHNRLESICGLERLVALERVDLRGNLIEESAEIGRLAILPNIADVWIEGNPLVELEENYRVECFEKFWKEEKTVRLDGTPPGFYERRNLPVSPPEQMSSSRPLSIAYSPPVVAVGLHPHQHTPIRPAPVDKYPTPPSSNASPSLAPVGAVGVGGKPRRKKLRRVVDLDGEHSDGSSAGANHSRNQSTASSQLRPKTKVKLKEAKQGSPLPEQSPLVKKWGQIGTLDAGQDEGPARPEFSVHVNAPTPIERASSTSTVVPAQPSTSPQKAARRTRHGHGRYQTDFIPASTSRAAPELFSSPIKSPEESSSSSSTSPMTSTSLRNGRASGSATFSSSSGMRRARVSASVYEPPNISDGEDGGRGGEDIRDNADAYRRRIEALKKDMGDGWLKVFSQSQMKS
ncbi:hypothetical protein D9615_002487 [Tricholomella constricta]|uniref:Leucine rich repeat domain-containing protein n=1 Tax=Tricholomella constricta TaxID=117010 RepID=A0A8H5HLV7_9AGAR|nr:hypothetical protein D9615_002487 [Tricholomella constricta]